MRLDGVVEAKLIRRDLAQVFYDAAVTNPDAWGSCRFADQLQWGDSRLRTVASAGPDLPISNGGGLLRCYGSKAHHGDSR